MASRELVLVIFIFLPEKGCNISSSFIIPNEYIVLTPMTDNFDYFADNLPQFEISEVRISFFTKSNYIERKNQITELLLQYDFNITGRWYIGHEDDTGYHHYAIDVEKNYKFN
ncbi:MAG: hypothetical protein J6P21_01385 [Clostridia bacterium]|nr:hypothetical protein [Clostridia bacterium]